MTVQYRKAQFDFSPILWFLLSLAVGEGNILSKFLNSPKSAPLGIRVSKSLNFDFSKNKVNSRNEF